MIGQAVCQLLPHGEVGLGLQDAVVALGVEIDDFVDFEETGEEVESVCVALVEEGQFSEWGIVHE